jgi:hypothetical protein
VLLLVLVVLVLLLVRVLVLKVNGPQLLQKGSAALFTYWVFVSVSIEAIVVAVKIADAHSESGRWSEQKLSAGGSLEDTSRWSSDRCPDTASVPPAQINAFNSSWESMVTNECGEKIVSKSGIQREGVWSSR